jgi:putative transposase
MKRARLSEEQIIGVLKAAEAAGNIRSVCSEHNITEQTFYRWRPAAGAPEGCDITSLPGRRARTGLIRPILITSLSAAHPRLYLTSLSTEWETIGQVMCRSVYANSSGDDS